MAHSKKTDGDASPYPPGDSRNITLRKSDNPIEPPRSGPAEHHYRDDDTARDADGEPTAERGDTTKANPTDPKKPVGETSPDPAARARADANRPLGS